MGQIALSPAFRALDTRDLRRGLRGHRTNRPLACISRTRHARSPQRVARAWDTSHSRLHFARHTISTEGCAGTGQIAHSPAFRALDTHDLRRGLSPDKSHSRLHFAHSTRTISAEGCGQVALSPAFRALGTHDFCRGLRAHGTNRTLARLHFAHSTRTISAEGCASSLQNERFRTRLPQKLTGQSLQNERFVRDFLQKSSGNTHRSTHITQPCQAVSRFQLLQTTSAHTPIPNVTATLTSTTTHNLTIPCACHESFRVHTSNAHKVLHLPRNVTSVTPRNLTIPCACHENRTSTPQHPHKVLRACHEK